MSNAWQHRSDHSDPAQPMMMHSLALEWVTYRPSRRLIRIDSKPLYEPAGRAVGLAPTQPYQPRSRVVGGPLGVAR